MSTTKLTNYMRERIVKDLIAHRFVKPADKLTKEWAALAGKVYRDFYPRAMLSKLDALPEGWLPVDQDIRAQFAGRVGGLDFAGARYGEIAAVSTPTERISKRFLSKDKRRVLAVYDANHPIAVAHADLQARTDSLAEQIRAARRQAEAAVNSASSVGGLIKLWPEVEPFARKHERAKVMLPSLPTKELNALLDLPVAA